MLWVRGLVALTCITVTSPMANPMHPVIVMTAQNAMEVSLSLFAIMI
jgi:hypothetical protein